MIIISEKFRITFQPNSFDLEELGSVENKETKEDTPVWKKVSYHPNMVLAIKGAFRKHIATKKDVVHMNNIEQYFNKEIDKFMKTVKIEK